MPIRLNTLQHRSQRIIDYLGIQPSESQIRDAIKLVIKKDPAPLAVAKQAGVSEQQSVLLGLQADVRVQQIAGQEEFTARPSQKATVLTQHTSLLQTGEVRHEKIVATMMTGSNESIVGEAVQSALRFVDEVVLVDTGISDGTKEVVESIAKGKYVLVSFPWCQDFAAARNAALQFASDRGATWALTLDSDERCVFHPLRIAMIC